VNRPQEVDSPHPQASPVVGVALPIPEPWGGYLQQLRVAYGEERAEHIPTHITLMPPTPVAAEQVEPLREHLLRVAASHASFEVLLRGTGTFRPVSDVVYVQVAQGVSSCERLERAVRSGPVSRDLDFPYHPHVTVAHDRPEAVLDRAFSDLEAFTCAFTAEVFRLYVHGGDGVWRVEEQFTLEG
jgi:2'-5' RNA ligase